MKFKLMEEDMERKPHVVGSPEWNANEGRRNRIAFYRNAARLDEDAEITEDNIDKWALDKTCTYTNTDEERVLAEILGKKWSDLEEE